MSFFSSYIGMYMVQSISHSVLTLFIVEASLRVWEVDEVRERFRYRLLVLVLPFVMFPLFQLLNPDRGSFYFVQDTAVFSSLNWLNLSVFGVRPFFYIFLLVTGGVSCIVLVQEVFPIVRDWLRKPQKQGGEGKGAGPFIEEMVGEISDFLKIDKPSVFVIDDENPVIYTTGTKEHAIVISERLLTVFSARELRGALAHEAAHIVRRSNIMTLLVFFVRICMFYNPISLLEFRKLVQDDEHICDDITVSVTRDPVALASALKVFCLDVPHDEAFRLSSVKEAIESSSHNLLLNERIERLENHVPFDYHAYGWVRYSTTLATIIVMSYFVV
jgi:Zn-dependent protease with chaperone function